MVDNVIEQFDRMGILPHTLPNAIGMWPEEQECLVWCAEQCDPDINWLEIGSFCGGSTLLLGFAKKQMGGKSKIFAVDNNFNPMFDYNVKKSKLNNIVKLECNSWDILQYYNAPLSFIFIDGWHSFSAAINEFQLLQSLMTEDCIVGFHDVSPQMTKNDPKYIQKCYEIGMKEFNSLISSGEQDFRLDEAIAIICVQYKYEIVDIPIRTNPTHFQETRLTEWVRGETSPFNSFTAIRKIK